MSYATVQDMIDRYSEVEMVSLTDREYNAEIIPAVAQTALDDATGEINGYLIKYTKPFDVIPRTLLTYCCDIARYRLTGGEVLETNIIGQRYLQAISYLEKVAAGKISLTVDENGKEAETASVVMFSDKQKVFGRDNPY